MLGTWTIESNVHSSTGNNKLGAHFIMHLTCNSQKPKCSLPNCSELDNKVCLLNSSSSPSCHEINTTVVDWSDVNAYFYFGLKVDAGFPINKHLSQSTGSWVGPYNLILAQDLSPENKSVIDSYTVKYVNSPLVPHLKFPHDCDLISPPDFQDYFGPGAVEHTVSTQSLSQNGFIDDFYAPYLNTCDNGNVKSILPKIQIDFDVNEEINIQIQYKILSFPKKDSILSKLFHKIVKMDKYPLSGPYCYDNDAHRAYTIDLNYSSLVGNDYVALHHACVEDLPCIPPGVQHCVNCNVSSGSSSDADYSHSSTSSQSSDIPFWLSPTMLLVLMICLVVSIVLNVYYWRRNRGCRNRTNTTGERKCLRWCRDHLELEQEKEDDQVKYLLLENKESTEPEQHKTSSACI